MEEKICFSIIICTYNGKKTLSRAIESILLQKNYETLVKQFIVVDNASDDETKNIISAYVDRGVLYSYEPTQGLSNARLNGVKIASSPWIVFVDDDNQLDENWLENASRFIVENPDVAVFCGTSVPKLDFVPTEEEKNNLLEFHNALAVSNISRDTIDFSLKAGPLWGAGLVYKTSILKELADNGWLKLSGRKGNNLASGEDGEMIHYALRNNYRTGYCPGMILEHNISKARLQSDYILNLYKKIIESCYYVDTLDKKLSLRRLKSLAFRLRPVTKKNKSILRYKIDKEWKRYYLKMTIKDILSFCNASKKQISAE